MKSGAVERRCIARVIRESARHLEAAAIAIEEGDDLWSAGTSMKSAISNLIMELFKIGRLDNPEVKK